MPREPLLFFPICALKSRSTLRLTFTSPGDFSSFFRSLPSPVSRGELTSTSWIIRSAAFYFFFTQSRGGSRVNSGGGGDGSPLPQPLQWERGRAAGSRVRAPRYPFPLQHPPDTDRRNPSSHTEHWNHQNFHSTEKNTANMWSVWSGIYYF